MAGAPRAAWRLAELDQATLPRRLAIPFGLAAAVAAAVLVAFPAWWWASVKLVVGYVVTPVGQEVWLVFGHTHYGLPYAYVSTLLFLVNLSVALFFGLVVRVEALATRLPWIGRRVARLEERIRSHAWARRSLVAALTAIVFLPIHSGGAVLGPMAGRLLGLPWTQAVAAVVAAIFLRFLVFLLFLYGVLSLGGLWG